MIKVLIFSLKKENMMNYLNFMKKVLKMKMKYNSGLNVFKGNIIYLFLN